MNSFSQNALKIAIEKTLPPQEFAETSCIRIAGPEDHQVLLDLINAAFYEHNWYKKENFKRRVTPETLSNYMASPSNFYLLMENHLDVDGEAVDGSKGKKKVALACVYVRMENEEKFQWQRYPGIMMFSINPLYKQRGLGKYIFQVASECIGYLHHIRESNCSNQTESCKLLVDSDIDLASDTTSMIQIEVVNVNTHLIEMYQKWGFIIDKIWSVEEYGLVRLEELEVQIGIAIMYRLVS